VTRPGTLAAAAAIALVGVACHKAPVTNATPAPVTTTAQSNDNDARDRARRDSIARANAARQAAADREAAARQALTATVFFDYDQDALTADATSRLEAKVPVMQQNRDVRIRVEGNTDERGSDEYNLALGQRRAAAARRFLVSRGIEDARIETVSYGEERPSCGDHEESCWSKNRRDLFVVTAGRLMGTQP